MATVLSAIIPSYGTVNKWYKGSVTSKEFSRFIRELSFIVRSKICTQKTQIIIIADNASIHKTEEVRDMFTKCKITCFYTVPYSPQTNIPAENYFSRMKYILNFDHTIYKLYNIDMPDIDDEEENDKGKDEEKDDYNDSDDTEDEKKRKEEDLINGLTKTKLLTEDEIVVAWTRMSKIKYTSAITGNIVDTWFNILQECKNCKPLNGSHYKKSKNSRNFIFDCYRK